MANVLHAYKSYVAYVGLRRTAYHHAFFLMIGDESDLWPWGNIREHMANGNIPVRELYVKPLRPAIPLSRLHVFGMYACIIGCILFLLAAGYSIFCF